MGKITKSITIEDTIVKKIEDQADDENRNFSNMVEVMAAKYLELVSLGEVK
jgi:hypothetical protein